MKHAFVQGQEPPAPPTSREAGPGRRVDETEGVARKEGREKGRRRGRGGHWRWGRDPATYLVVFMDAKCHRFRSSPLLSHTCLQEHAVCRVLLDSHSAHAGGLVGEALVHEVGGTRASTSALPSSLIPQSLRVETLPIKVSCLRTTLGF